MKTTEKNPHSLSTHSVTIPLGQRGTVKLSRGEIPGARVNFHSLPAGDNLERQNEEGILRICFLLAGKVELTSSGTVTLLSERAVYVASPSASLAILCNNAAQLLEIEWALTGEDLSFLSRRGQSFPIVQHYEKSPQYREDFKSEQCISRAILHHHTLPRFCMGSNESYGPDRVEPHAHPLIDQYFFSFPDNDVNLLIDDAVQPYGGYELIQIPLGSNHGVEIPADRKMHYLWIDFLIDPRGVAYLDDVHKATEHEEFDHEHRKIKKK